MHNTRAGSNGALKRTDPALGRDHVRRIARGRHLAALRVGRFPLERNAARVRVASGRARRQSIAAVRAQQLIPITTRIR